MYGLLMVPNGVQQGPEQKRKTKRGEPNKKSYTFGMFLFRVSVGITRILQLSFAEPARGT